MLSEARQQNQPWQRFFWLSRGCLIHSDVNIIQLQGFTELDITLLCLQIFVQQFQQSPETQQSLNDTRRNNICYLVGSPRFLPYCLLGYFLLCNVTYQQRTYSTYERFSRTIKNHHSQVVVIKALPQNLSQATATLDWYASGITTKFVVQLDPTTAAAEFPEHVIKCLRYIVRKIWIDRFQLKQFVL